MSEFLPQIGSESRFFTLVEVEALLPVLLRITAQSQKEMEPVVTGLHESLPGTAAQHSLEGDYKRVLNSWKSKMERLGVEPTGRWQVDFHTGQGCLCWRYPELKLYWHENHESCEQRIALHEAIEQLDPDWALEG